MRDHCRPTHDGARQRFFEVARKATAPQQGGDSDEDAITSALDNLIRTAEHREEEEHRRAAARLPVEVTAADSSPWLRKIRWGRL
ncbi:hypothetical protein B0A48_18356 [Cryoendolithus antarcticus]|uniref:Uncharacterized protein n=1 Tax=Cryoendolithus antarcticus TaxID=1507870 RepID=A0A1V8SB18_9PEZI|nr:hypothetical protein B0A48_18356 [Cryoendolithus antarcticus]